MRRSVCPMLLTLSVAIGCGGIDGDEAAARGLVNYESADGGFSVAYLSPPWEVRAQEDAMLELEVPAELFGVSLEGSPPTHGFRIEYVDAPEGLDALLENQELLDQFDTDGLDTEGLPETGDLEDLIPEDEAVDIPEYLIGIDLANPRDVTFGELRYLVEEQGAQLDEPIRRTSTQSGLEGFVYQVILDPGVYVRSFYFPGPDRAIRAVFASVFNLQDGDIDWMVGSVETTTSTEPATETP